ncbi:MAG: SCO family protein [Acidobacteria bacterium]|nr:SCO family protein [Acidobacteriota bacterium]
MSFASRVASLALRADGPEQLLEVCNESNPVYRDCPPAAIDRMRAWVFSALARAKGPLPSAAIPVLIEELETGHDPCLMAAAAACLRTWPEPHEDFAPPLAIALRNARSRDVPVTLNHYGGWTSPDANQTSPLLEILATIDWLPAIPPPLEDELRSLRDAGAARESALAAARSVLGKQRPGCCSFTLSPALFGRLTWTSQRRRGLSAIAGIELEDHNGGTRTCRAAFVGHPTIVAFFYTRCDNPLKCSLTVWKLGRVRNLLVERGLSDAIHTAAITYDSQYDTADRLRRYGQNRGLPMAGDRHSLYRVPKGFETLRRHFDLGVSFFESIVSRHRVELFVLDSQGRVAHALSRVNWSEQEVVELATTLLSEAHSGTGGATLASAAGTSTAGVIASLLPKCPACWAMYMSSIGASVMLSSSALRWTTAAFLLLSVLLVAWRARANGFSWSAVLSLVGIVAVAARIFRDVPDAVSWSGAGLMILGSLLAVRRSVP